MKHKKHILRNMTNRIVLSCRGDIFDDYNILKDAQWQSKYQMYAMQRNKLEEILKHAYLNVPYYHDTFTEKKLHFCDDQPLDLKKFINIPLLDKKIIREQFENLKSNDLSARSWHKNTSGGSTGEPVCFIQDATHHEWGQGVKMLYNDWAGCHLGAKQIRLWGAERDLNSSMKSQIGRWLRNELWLNAYKLTPEKFIEHIARINQFRPSLILAYAHIIYELAVFVEQENLCIHSPLAIMTSAGTLYDDMRDTIESVFKAPVFNRYGSREVGDIACECSAHTGLHVCPVTHYVEILNERGEPTSSGEVGELVVTSFVNKAMPLIRYRIGDMAAWHEEECSCGRNWPLLKEIAGRVHDTLYADDGTRIYSAYFTRLFFYKEWIKKFQVVQEELNLIRVLIAPRTNTMVNESDVAYIADNIKRVMGAKCRIHFIYVDDIKPNASGKYRYVMSKLK